MLKKMMLLAGMALAAMVFAAPAAQASLDWDETGTIEGTGELTSDSENGIVTGPAVVHFVGQVEEGSSTGEITQFEITGPVPVAGLPCHASAIALGVPWQVHLSTPDTMTITDVTFVNFYTGEGCPLPPAVPVAGDVTLTVEKDIITGEDRCASADPYEDFKHLFIETTAIGVDLTGTVCWDGPAITTGP